VHRRARIDNIQQGSHPSPVSPTLVAWSGFATADPLLLGVLVCAIVILAGAYLARRLLERRRSRPTG
jgi:hypothetical protein